MCGIAGYIGASDLDEGRVATCLEAMRHRGPDHQGFRRFTTPTGRSVYLLSARLDIIDLHERSNQPLQVGPAWISYNGELYNYVEVRAKLEASGRAFATNSDTEVLAAAVQDLGWPALDDCEGMWAFAFYDETGGSLSLCRDRFGEKPLYLYRDETGLYFGSEVKFISSLAGRRLEPDLDHLKRHLVHGYRALYKGSATFFQGVDELESGTVLHIDAAGAESRERYWKPAFVTDERLSRDEAVGGVRERLIRAVELRLRADVPMAFCMSGGVDSVSLISIAKRVFDYDVHGFTIVNTDARYEEQDMVNYAVKELGVRHTEIPVSTNDFLPRLRTLVRAHDAPVYTISYYVHWLLMESIAREGYRISVSGSAADELFTGYYDHHVAYLHELRNDPARYAVARAAWEAHIKPDVRNPHLSDPELFDKTPGFRDYIYLNADEFAGYLTNGWNEQFGEEQLTDSLLRNRMLNELFYESIPVILHEDDLNAMFYSIENRSPYLDRHLCEFASRIPTRELINDGYVKSILRDSMRGIVPDQILDNRRKVGFNAPITGLLDLDDPAVRNALLDDGPIFEHVRKDRIEALVAKRDFPNSESKFLFNFLNAKIFLEEFAA
jgi:asparagine synthase (glutamine-hydrolysing)